MVLGQLCELRLVAAINVDIAGSQSHARALDEDSEIKPAMQMLIQKEFDRGRVFRLYLTGTSSFFITHLNNAFQAF